jgi:hypothetical protein
MCRGCPFNPDRDWRAVPYSAEDWQHAYLRIAEGERWICHESCPDDLVGPKSVRCKGAADGRVLLTPPGTGAPLPPGAALDLKL